MRLAITSHAVDRWSELLDPPLPLLQARRELEQSLASRPERCGTTRAGQAVFRVQEPRLAYLVVKLGPDKHAKNYSTGTPSGVIVTVLPLELWERDRVDEQAELEEAMARAEAERPAAPRQRLNAAPLRPAPPPAKLSKDKGDWMNWMWVVATIERDRRIAEADRCARAHIDQLTCVFATAKRFLEGRCSQDALAKAVARVPPCDYDPPGPPSATMNGTTTRKLR